MLGDAWIDLGRPHADSDLVLCIKSLGGGIVLAGSRFTPGPGHWFKSANWGLSWTDKGGMPSGTNERYVYALVDCKGGVVMAGMGANEPQVSRSVDYGDSFTWIKKLANFQDSTPSGAYLGTYGGDDIVIMGTGTNWTTAPRIFRSLDKGATWDGGQMISGMLDDITNLLSLGGGTAIYSSGDGEIGRTTDYGVNWDQDIYDFGGPSKAAMNLLNIGGVVYALLADGEVWKSSDQGSSWTKVGETGTTAARGFAYVPELGLMFAGVGGIGFTGHIYRSQNLGATWADLGRVSPEGGIRTIEYIHKASEHILLAGDGGTVSDDVAHIYRASEPISITPVAEFSGTPTSGYAPLTVQFTDLSTNTPTSWLWNFGDGETSRVQNPSHIYQEVGIYTVTLTATNAAGSDDEVKTDYITVLPPPIAANFSAQPLAGKYPLTVHFTDLSTGEPLPASWLWDFGDGETSEEQNPRHIYKEAGLYTVSLTATNETGSDTETKFGYIEAIERAFIEKRGIEERQLMKIRHISLKRGLAMAERIPMRIIDVTRDPAPKRIWK